MVAQQRPETHQFHRQEVQRFASPDRRQVRASALRFRSNRMPYARSIFARIILTPKTTMAKHVSEVEDGFGLKRQRDNGKCAKKRKVKGEHTILPSPIKHILSSYTMSNP